MKITITGSLGRISMPLTKILVHQGHSVTVISSKAERQKDIESIGAKAAIGTMENVDFLSATFKGTDVIYVMEPPVNFFDKTIDIMKFYSRLAENYAQAIRQSGVKRIVHLSSIGAHTDKGNGMLAFHYNVEQILGALPANVAMITLRPVGFYYNTLAFINVIKTQGAIISNYGGDEKEPWVSPLDIASVVAEEIVKPFEGRRFRYIASDELSPNELAKILGEAIGKPDLKWRVIPDEQRLNILLSIGMNPQAAKGLMEMDAGRRGSLLYEDYYRHRPILGKVKMTEYAKEFAAVYHSNS